MAMAVIARAVTAAEHAGLGSPGIDELRWKKPVYPGDTLTVRGTVIDVRASRSKPDIGSVRTDHVITNQDGETVMSFTSIVLMRRRPEGQ
jgi:acyl dehydratase